MKADYNTWPMADIEDMLLLNWPDSDPIYKSIKEWWRMIQDYLLGFDWDDEPRQVPDPALFETPEWQAALRQALAEIGDTVDDWMDD